MAAPARRSLRERDQRAIDPAPPLPGQTAIDMPDAPQPTAAQPEPAAAPPMASTSAVSPAQAPAGAGQGARRLGIYFHPADFTNAKAAYLADWQNGGSADTFAAWIGGVLLDHTQLNPAQRASAALPPRQSGAGSTRSFALPAAVHDAVRAAVITDQGVGRWVSVSAWAGMAIYAAVETARWRASGPLPAPPRRLPNYLRRA